MFAFFTFSIYVLYAYICNFQMSNDNLLNLPLGFPTFTSANFKLLPSDGAE